MTEGITNSPVIGMYALVFLGATAGTLGIFVYFTARFLRGGLGAQPTAPAITIGLTVSGIVFVGMLWIALALFGIVGQD
jgi:hypothetical protein